MDTSYAPAGFGHRTANSDSWFIVGHLALYSGSLEADHQTSNSILDHSKKIGSKLRYQHRVVLATPERMSLEHRLRIARPAFAGGQGSSGIGPRPVRLKILAICLTFPHGKEEVNRRRTPNSTQADVVTSIQVLTNNAVDHQMRPRRRPTRVLRRFALIAG